MNCGDEMGERERLEVMMHVISENQPVTFGEVSSLYRRDSGDRTIRDPKALAQQLIDAGRVKVTSSHRLVEV